MWQKIGNKVSAFSFGKHGRLYRLDPFGDNAEKQIDSDIELCLSGGKAPEPA